MAKLYIILYFGIRGDFQKALKEIRENKFALQGHGWESDAIMTEALV